MLNVLPIKLPPVIHASHIYLDEFGPWKRTQQWRGYTIMDIYLHCKSESTCALVIEFFANGMPEKREYLCTYEMYWDALNISRLLYLSYCNSGDHLNI